MPVAQLRDSPQPGLAAGCVLFWHETTGSPANSRPQANLPAAVTLAQRQAAICGPVPGMVARLTLVLSLQRAARTALSSLPISEPRLCSAATMGASAVRTAGGRCPPSATPHDPLDQPTPMQRTLCCARSLRAQLLQTPADRAAGDARRVRHRSDPVPSRRQRLRGREPPARALV